MQNLELLKQQLIAQKDMLESKGISVACANTNPSPTELTTAISHISPVDMSYSTVTPNDVMSGKKFYNSTGELQEGTYVNKEREILINYNDNNIVPETLPDVITGLKPYMYYACNSVSNKFIIPDFVTTIPSYAFYRSLFSEFVIPTTVTTFKDHCFATCVNLTYACIPDHVTTVDTYVYVDCPQATTIYIGTGITILPFQTFKKTPKIKTLTFPANIERVKGSNFQVAPELEDMIILGTKVPFEGPYVDTPHANFKIWVPFEDLYFYGQASNHTTHCEQFISKVTLTDETEFPVCPGTTTRYLVWYGNLEDALAKTNKITTPNGAGDYYARLEKTAS